RREIVGEIDLELVRNVVKNDAFDAEARAANLGRAHIGPTGYVKVLIDGVVIGLKAAADLETELAVAARQLGRALPLDLQIEIAAAGICRRCVRGGGLGLGVGDLLL